MPDNFWHWVIGGFAFGIGFTAGASIYTAIIFKTVERMIEQLRQKRG